MIGSSADAFFLESEVERVGQVVDVSNAGRIFIDEPGFIRKVG